MNSARPPQALLPAVALISAAALGYEILLMRLLSIIHWHHFAYMVISLALLGYGVSGTLIALERSRLERSFATAFALSALLFGVTLTGCFLLAQRLPFNALEVLWDHRQWLYLLLLYLLFFIPFLFAAACIGMAFTRYRGWTTQIYRADLLGAGGGALLMMLTLFLWRPETCLRGLGVAACVAALLVARHVATHRWLWIMLPVTAITGLLLLPQSWMNLRLSPYKGLSQTLAVMDTQQLAERSSPLGLVSVVASPSVPFRHAPGLSLHSPAEPPAQLALFTDGDGMSVINQGAESAAGYLGATIDALPYRLLSAPEVLILGAGGGSGVTLAQRMGARQIDAVELNPDVVELVRDRFSDFAGGLYQAPKVRLHTAEARGFVARSPHHFDLIQVALLDSLAVSGAGIQGSRETYLYTVEALQSYLGHLKPGGILAISRWLKLPPRDGLKLFATAIAALEESGVSAPANRLALIRSWNTSLLLIKNGAWREEEIATMERFADRLAFDLSYFPGISEARVNRYNQLETPYLYRGATALLSQQAPAFIDRYKFDLTPATDDRPYFFHFFKWRALPELLDLSRRGGGALLEWGYLILVATLFQALLVGGLLILWPLWRFYRTAPPANPPTRLPLRGGYFLLLGFAFIFVEIAFIQKFTLFLSHPLYAVAVVLSGFLLFAGLGSGFSAVLKRRLAVRALQPVSVAVAGILIVGTLYLWLLPPLFARLIGIDEGLRILVALLLIAPLAFCMGMPFPLGLLQLSGDAEAFTPWAWGLNGFASVVGAVLATVLAIEFGFTLVVALALGGYALAAWGLFAYL